MVEAFDEGAVLDENLFTVLQALNSSGEEKYSKAGMKATEFDTIFVMF